MRLTSPSYGTLLGMTVFQSFINGIVSFRALPRQHFGNFQEKLFPIYFRLQTGLPVALAITYPGVKAVTAAGLLLGKSGVAGVMEEQNRYSVLMPLAGMFLCNGLNAFFLGPQTTKVMHERRALGMLIPGPIHSSPKIHHRLLTRHREQGRQEILGRRNPVTRHAEDQQAFRADPRR